MKRVFLTPLSWLYGAAVVVRNAAFTLGLLPVRRVGVPVISVGNMTAGGTGKTPLVEYLARWCIKRGLVTAIVSRGYGRSGRGVVVVSDGKNVLVNAAQGGDEPVQLAGRCPGAIVVVGERRVAAAETAVRSFGANVVIMDDGFQHRYLYRDLDIVTVHGRRKLPNEPLLPVGLRREPLGSLGRANLVMVSHAADGAAVTAAGRLLAPWYRGPLAGMTHAPEGLFCDIGLPAAAGATQGGAVLVFCGIGDPDGFRATLGALGIVAAVDAVFPDHHRYTRSDLESLRSRAAAHHAAVMVTTEKDFVRLRATGLLEAAGLPVLYLGVRATIVEGEDRLHRLLEDTLH
jgi:tetraacyldisaccharide 4'-kinase